MKFYYAVLAGDDGMPTKVDLGGSTSETVVARIALRAANEHKRTAYVMEKDSYRKTERITQTISYFGNSAGIAVPPPMDPRD